MSAEELNPRADELADKINKMLVNESAEVLADLLPLVLFSAATGMMHIFGITETLNLLGSTMVELTQMNAEDSKEVH